MDCLGLLAELLSPHSPAALDDLGSAIHQLNAAGCGRRAVEAIRAAVSRGTAVLLASSSCTLSAANAGPGGDATAQHEQQQPGSALAPAQVLLLRHAAALICAVGSVARRAAGACGGSLPRAVGGAGCTAAAIAFVRHAVAAGGIPALIAALNNAGGSAAAASSSAEAASLCAQALFFLLKDWGRLGQAPAENSPPLRGVAERAADAVAAGAIEALSAALRSSSSSSRGASGGSSSAGSGGGSRGSSRRQAEEEEAEAARHRHHSQLFWAALNTCVFSFQELTSAEERTGGLCVRSALLGRPVKASEVVGRAREAGLLAALREAVRGLAPGMGADERCTAEAALRSLQFTWGSITISPQAAAAGGEERKKKRSGAKEQQQLLRSSCGSSTSGEDGGRRGRRSAAPPAVGRHMVDVER